MSRRRFHASRSSRDDRRAAQPVFDERDVLDQLVDKRGSSLWLGLLTREMILAELERAGVLQALGQRGFHHIAPVVVPLDLGDQTLRVFSGEDLIAEIRVRSAPLRVRRRLEDGWGQSPPRLLMIDWQLLQDPRASFSAARPALPGQRHPGLGMSKRAVPLLERLARRLKLEGVAAVPEHFHSAFMFRRRFHFYDPELEGRLLALHRDLPGGLAEQAWAIELGCVRERKSGQTFRWEGDLQILPLSERLRGFLGSPAYAERRDAVRDRCRFVLEAETFRRLYPPGGPTGRGTMTPADAPTAGRTLGESPMKHQSVDQLFREIVATDGSKIAYRYKAGGTWHDVSWQEHARTVQSLSRALMALGVNKGDRVSILSQTRLEWVQADFGIGGCGGVTVGIYPSNLGPECAYIINHSDTRVLFAEDHDQLAKLDQVRGELPNLKKIVLFDGEASSDPNVLSWKEFIDLGHGVSDQQLDRRTAEIRPDDLCSLVYTSGTTGVPKGAMITHRNLLFTSESASRSLYTEPHFETLLFLPLAHVFARLIVYSALRTRNTVAFAESIQAVADNLREVRPHYIASAPRIYEKVYDKITSGVEEVGGLKKKIFDWAVGVGTAVSKLKQQKQPIAGLLSLKNGLAHRLVFHKIHEALGGRLVYAVSGAAPLNQDIAQFFHSCGVLILEGLGMTENTSFTNVNRFDNYRFGTVGPLGPGIEMKLADDGEILFRGPNVMRGYFKSPEATAETIDPQGWLFTGDIGEIDSDGFLKITDRKKDLIITAGGKNVAPQRIEKMIRTSHYISQVVAIGDRRKFISALITLEPEAVAAWAREKNIQFGSVAELSCHPAVVKLVEAEVEARCRQLASFESVKKFRILPHDLTVESGEMTPTFKVKRKVVLERNASLVEEMYTE